MNDDNNVCIDNDEVIEEEMESEKDADADADVETAPTPSPQAKKDMSLRSGRRKRRRSKETSGLTPPETIRKIKKARKSTTNSTGTSESDVIENTNKKTAPTEASLSLNTVAVAGSLTSASEPNATAQTRDNGESALNVAVGNNGGSPVKFPDTKLISYAQEPANILPHIPSVTTSETYHRKIPSESKVDEPLVDDNASSRVSTVRESSRFNSNLFDGDVIVTEQSTPKDVDLKAKQVQEEKYKEISDDNGFVDAREAIEEGVVTVATTNIFWKSWLMRNVASFVLFLVCILALLPSMLTLAEYLIPFDDSILPPSPKIRTQSFQIENETESEVEEIIEYEEIPEDKLLNWNSDLMKELKKLSDTKKEYTSFAQELSGHYNKASFQYQELQKRLHKQIALTEDRLDELIELEKLLENRESKHDDDQYDQTLKMTQRVLGKTLIKTDSIELWNFPDNHKIDCNLVDIGIIEEEEEEEETEPLLSLDLFEEKVTSLSLRSTITAEKFIGGGVAEDRVRKWVQSKIKKAIDDDEDVLVALDEKDKILQKLSRSTSDVTEMVDDSSQVDMKITEIVQDRLEVHRADTTGVFDYASLKNGAKIIYRGKRGTSKSLIDYLPILNRILQNANLGFYGFGPEAALTPTYPPNTLGQCWSFQQTSLKEQLEERQLYQDGHSVPDDFKRGNFGTLTISFIEPIFVNSVIIEHPSVLFKSQALSAIRSFRVVGYEDAMASSKSWNLGSFEYSLQKNKKYEYLQEFEVANTVFGKEIPRLHAISLAIDSNHGHEYACLYRFRVHSYEE